MEVKIPPPCTFTLSPLSKTFPASGGNGSVSVSSPYSCSWNATSDVAWITLKSGGSGTVSYTVAANTSAAQRTGTLTIAGQSFLVTQSGAQSGKTKTK